MWPLGAFDRGGDVLFLDVHVEGVEQKPGVVRADILDHPHALIDRVDEIGLEPVERLDRQLDRAG